MLLKSKFVRRERITTCLVKMIVGDCFGGILDTNKQNYILDRTFGSRSPMNIRISFTVPQGDN